VNKVTRKSHALPRRWVLGFIARPIQAAN
jgi:hypothetical protein